VIHGGEVKAEDHMDGSGGQEDAVVKEDQNEGGDLAKKPTSMHGIDSDAVLASAKSFRLMSKTMNLLSLAAACCLIAALGWTFQPSYSSTGASATTMSIVTVNEDNESALVSVTVLYRCLCVPLQLCLHTQQNSLNFHLPTVIRHDHSYQLLIIRSILFFACILGVSAVMHTSVLGKLSSAFTSTSPSSGRVQKTKTTQWRKLCFCLLLSSGGILNNAVATEQEPLSLASLSPEPFQEALSAFRGLLQDTVWDSMSDAYEDTGIDVYIEEATEAVEDVAESVGGALQGLRSSFTDSPDADSFYAFVDSFIEDKAQEIFEDFEGVCNGGSSGTGRRSRSLAERRLALEAQEQNLFLKHLAEQMGPVAPFKGGTTNPTLPTLPSGLGAIALTLGVGKGYQWKNKKRGLTFEGSLGVGFDYGILLDSGDFKTTVAIGPGVAVGREVPDGPEPTQSPTTVTPVECIGAKYRDDANNCQICPRGYFCFLSTVTLCPKGRFCNAGTGALAGSQGNICPVDPSGQTDLCPTEGHFKNSDGQYLNICDQFSERLDDVPCTRRMSQDYQHMRTKQTTALQNGRSLEEESKVQKGWTKTSLTLGLTVYLGGNAGDMDGWGSWDVGIDLGLTFIKGITFHVGHPWYACRQCSCDNILDGRLRKPSEFFGAEDGWKLSGFTIDFIDFNDLEGYKEQLKKFNDNGGMKGAIGSFLNSFTSTKNFKGAMKQFEGSLSFSPVLAVGVISTEDDWDITENFNKLAWADLTDEPCSDFDDPDKCNCPSTASRRFLRNQEKKNHTKAYQGLPVEYTSGTTPSISRNTSLSNVRKLSPSHGRQLGITDSIKDVMSVLADLFGTGGIKVPYCFGDCTSGAPDYKKFQGDITLAPPEDCSELTLTASADNITLSNVAYVLLNEIDLNLANTVVNIIGPFTNFGVDQATVALTVRPYPEIILEVKGSPALPDLDPGASAVEKFFYDIFDKLTLGVTGSVKSFERVYVRLDAKFPVTDIGDSFSIQSVENEGAGIYFKFEIIDLMPTPPATPTQITSFGIDLPMKICVRDCQSTPEHIYLEGTVFVEFVSTSTLPPVARIGGMLTMKSPWSEAFGLAFLHIDNVIAGATFSLNLPFPSPPLSLILGASACLGSVQACKDQDPTANDFIDAAAYLGLDAAVPQNNFFIAMVTSFTLENVLNVAAVVEPKLKNLISGLPKAVLDSGITPFDATKCVELNTTKQALGEQSVDLNCYAYVVVSPLAENYIEAIDLTIPRGISFGGKLNLFDIFEIRTEAQIDVLGGTKNPSFYLSVELRNLKLGDFLEIGRTWDKDTNKIEGDAFFLVDYVGYEKGTPKLLVVIEGAIGIPALKTYGLVDISITDDGAKFEGEISIFGGLMEPSVLVEWDWAFTRFYLNLGDLVFAPRVLELDQLILDIKTADGLELLFNIKITVLAFSKLDATVIIEERNMGKNLWISFTLLAKSGLVDCRVVGEADLDPKDLTKTEFGDLSVTLLPGAAAKAIGKAVTAAIDAIEDTINAAVEAVGVAIQAIGEVLDIILKSLDFLAKAFEDFGKSLNLLFSGDPAGAAVALASAFETAFDPASWEAAGEIVLEGLEDAGLAVNDAVLGSTGISSKTSGKIVQVAPGDPDQWGCSMFRYLTITRRCWKACVFGCNVCSDTIGFEAPFSDAKCITIKKDALAKARAKSETAGTYGSGSKDTQSGNAAILNVKRAEFPAPDIDELVGKVSYSPDGTVQSSLITTITGKTKTLENGQDSGYSSTETAFTPMEVTINLSPSDRRRLQEGGGSISEDYLESLSVAFDDLEQLINNTANKDMTGLDSQIKQFGERSLVVLEIAFLNADRTLSVSCSDIKSVGNRKPQIVASDPDCGSNTFLQSRQAMSFTRAAADFKVPDKYACGTVEISRQYKAFDKCDQEDTATQTIFLEPEAPEFSFVPAENAEKSYSTKDESFSPKEQGGNWPEASSVCGHAVEIDSTDAVPEEIPGNCGLWNVKRIWEAMLVFSEEVDTYCEDNGLKSPPSTKAIQEFHVKDDEAPRFIENVAAELRIPFFNNYNSTRLNAPLIKDIATNSQAEKWGLAVGEEMMKSEDVSLFILPTTEQDEASCRENGIAQFHRKWTIKDECGNEQTFLQKIIIEHPPEILTPTPVLSDGVFSYSPGIVQSQDACVPGKNLAFGPKGYEADFDFSVNSHVCVDGQVWNENGCRLRTNIFSSAALPAVPILSVKPEFVTFPDDVFVTTKDSISTDSNGVPVGAGFCSTPFEIVHEDNAAVLTACGVWEIQRHWTIRPVYDGCALVTDERLVSERVQVITIKDVYAPEFTFLPESQVEVPFLGDYGPANIDVKFPTVQDQVYHQTLIDHAQLHNTADTFLFVSYDVTLSYEDNVTFKKNSSEVCDGGSLADVSRTWTTIDSCENTASWIQTIQIVKPSENLFGDASGYQMASPDGHIHLHDSHVSQTVMSEGTNFDMKHSTIYCSSDRCNETDTALVLDSCPSHKIKEYFMPNGTVLYQDVVASSKSSKKSKKSEGKACALNSTPYSPCSF
jgi:hypothetical protein